MSSSQFNTSSESYNDTSSSRAWLLSMDQIEPGNSAILGNNEVVFYTIHLFGIFTILISLLGCTTVIFSVCRNSRNCTKWDFSDRFPLYLAISDALWAICNLPGGHIILMCGQVYPEKSVATALSVYVFFFFGYQQMMNSILSIYTYMRVVRGVSLQFGRWEWKVHVSVVLFIMANAIHYWYLDAFGNGGFWFLMDVKTTWGKVLAVQLCIISSIHAIFTLTAYRAIISMIKTQRRVFSNCVSQVVESKYGKVATRNNTSLFLQNLRYTTATKCLTTFILISLLVYIPFSVVTWIFVILGFVGYIEPTTALLIVIYANSGGLVNACGYFHNRKIKNGIRARNTHVRRSPINIQNHYSTTSSSSI